jgi:hypothetical protein
MRVLFVFRTKIDHVSINAHGKVLEHTALSHTATHSTELDFELAKKLFVVNVSNSPAALRRSSAR